MSSSSYNPNITLTSLSTQQGEINLVTNPIAEFDASNWTTSSATLTRSSTGVLSPVIPTGFTASSTTSTTSYVQTSLLNVPATLRNRKLKVQLYIQCADTATWKVDVLKSDGSTRYTLSTDSSGVSALPALTGTYTTTFDMDTGSGIYVRLTRYAGSGTSTLSFTNLIVGPGIQPQGAAVQEWQSYTPALTASVSNPTTSFASGRYRRVGSSIEIQAAFTVTAYGSGSYIISLPSGLSINYSGMAAIGQDHGIGAGNGYVVTNGGVTRLEIIPGFNNLSPFIDKIVFLKYNGTTLGNGDFSGASSSIFVVATVAISQWSGSGTVQLAQNDVEYAWNSDPGTTAGTTYSNSTYYGYGPNGTSIPAIASTTTTGESKTVYTVVFQTPVQATDQVVVELNDGNGWFNAAQRFPPFTNNAASYGVLLVAINSTTYRVAFGNAGYTPAGATTYAAAGGAWSGVTSWRWRVRKSSAGAAVGFGIVSSQSAGLLPVSNSNLDDATATRLGLKQYLHGTTYNGGVAPTVLAGTQVTNIGTVTRAVFCPYQMQDGAWRLKFNIRIDGATSTSATAHQIQINGITFKNITNYNQAISGYTNTQWSDVVVVANTPALNVGHSSNVAPTTYGFSGDVELESKPTWAY